MSDRDDLAWVHELSDDSDLDRALARVRADVHVDEGAISHGKVAVLAAAAELERAERSSDTIAAARPDAVVLPLAPTTDVAGRQQAKRSWRIVTAAAAVIVAALAVTSQLLPSDGGEIDSAAAAALEQAAEEAEKAGDPPVGPGRYRYTALLSWQKTAGRSDGKDYEFLSERVVETWVPADERQEWLERTSVTGKRVFLRGDAQAAASAIEAEQALDGKEDRAQCGSVGAESGEPRPCEGRPPGWMRPTAEWMAGLPREPAALQRRIETDLGGDRSLRGVHPLSYVVSVLNSGRAPVDLRAALYRVMALQPGGAPPDPAANLGGRIGTAFGFTMNGNRIDVVIDPATGQFLGYRVPGPPGGPPGAETAEYALLTVGVADKSGVKPK